MKILFPYVQGKINGPEKWRQDLSKELLKRHEVFCIATNKPSFLINFFKVFKTDIIHSYNQSFGTILILIIGKLLGKKIIHTVHGDFYSELKNKKGLKKIFWIPINNFQLFISKFITFPSKFTKDAILQKNSNISCKSFVLPNGINPQSLKKFPKIKKSSLKIDNDSLVFLEVTNFNHNEKAQGVFTLIKQYNKFVKTSGIKSILLIIGDGYLYKKYKKKYETQNIRFFGYRNDVVGLIKMADIVVHCSYLDNLPMFILEALACNKYVICNRIGGVPEINNKKLIITNNFFEFLQPLLKKIKQEKSCIDEDFKKFYINNICKLFENSIYNV